MVVSNELHAIYAVCRINTTHSTPQSDNSALVLSGSYSTAALFTVDIERVHASRLRRRTKKVCLLAHILNGAMCQQSVTERESRSFDCLNLSVASFFSCWEGGE